MKKTFRLLSTAIGSLALLGLPAAARAQLGTGTIIEADVPFAFHAGEARLPKGEYRLRVPEDGDGNLMEIRAVEQGPAAIFQVFGTEDRHSPTDSMLVFDKYGDTYYLRRVIQQGNPDGDELPVSRSEISLRKELAHGNKTAELRIPARSRAS